MLGLSSSSKLVWNFYIVSIANTASKKIGALIRFMKFLPSEVAFNLYRSTIQSCTQYCCHFWTGGPSQYLDTLDKLHNLFGYWAIGYSSLFCRYYFGRYSFQLAELDSLLDSLGRSTLYSNVLNYFLSLFLYVIRMSMGTVSLLPQPDSRICYLQNAVL